MNMADPATTRLANTVGYVYEDNDSYTRFEDEEGRDMVTDAYDASKTYAEGALCINDNKLYKAASAIETAEVWTPDHWTQTDINTELSSLNTKTTNIQTDLTNVNNELIATNKVLMAIWTSTGSILLNSTRSTHYGKVGRIGWVISEWGGISTPVGETVLGTLPIGHRPISSVGLCCCRNGFDNQYGTLYVRTSGVVTLRSEVSSFSYGRFYTIFPTDS